MHITDSPSVFGLGGCEVVSCQEILQGFFGSLGTGKDLTPRTQQVLVVGELRKGLKVRGEEGARAEKSNLAEQRQGLWNGSIRD